MINEFMKTMLAKLNKREIEISGYEYFPHHYLGQVPKYTKRCNCY